MGNRNITFFKVNNGNCCLIKLEDATLVVDLHGTDECSSYELIKPFLPERDGVRYLDVLCITHGDKDHCGGFEEFKQEMDNKRLVIGTIWHPNYDRTKVDNVKDLPKDYLALHAEIIRRRKIKDRTYGDIEIPLTAWDDEAVAFAGLPIPKDLTLRVLSPYVKDEGDTDWDVNDISLVININVSGFSTLFTGDSGSGIWQERIIPYTLKKEDKKGWAMADILLASHHGSFSFFGTNRDAVRDADPYPENYEALGYIMPRFLAVSANSRFPVNGDSEGDQPPHYAAWKWYHKWFRDNRGVGKDDYHPSQFMYTADGHIRLEWTDGKWAQNKGWTHKCSKGSSENKGFVYHGGETKRGPGQYA